MNDLSQGTLNKAKEIAPWRSGLAWWVVLVEGIILGLVGLLVIIDVQRANVNVALIFTAALALAGLLQLWALVRNRIPENLTSLVAGRAAIAVFAGLSILLLYFLDKLTKDVGLIVVGLASLLYGFIGLYVVFSASGIRRLAMFLEPVLFTIVGVLMIYTQFAGAGAVTAVVNIIGWGALLLGIGLIVFAILRQRQAQQAGVEAADAQVDDGALVEEAAADEIGAGKAEPAGEPDAADNAETQSQS